MMGRLSMIFVVLVGLLLTSSVASASHRRARVHVPRAVPHAVYRHPHVPYVVPHHRGYVRPHYYPGRVPYYVPYHHHYVPHHFHRHHFGYGGRGFSLHLGF
jgi:hypothetical protein